MQQHRHEGYLFSYPHRVGTVEAAIRLIMVISSVTRGCRPPIILARTPATSPYSLADPRRGCSCRIRNVTKSSGWTLGKPAGAGRTCPGELRTRGSRRDQLIIEIASRLTLHRLRVHHGHVGAGVLAELTGNLRPGGPGAPGLGGRLSIGPRTWGPEQDMGGLVGFRSGGRSLRARRRLVWPAHDLRALVGR